MARTRKAYSTRSAPADLARVWQAMRVLRRFTTADLQLTADAGTSAVEKFARALADAGYLVVAVPRVTGSPGSRNVWRLVRDTGPLAPIRRKDGSSVFDQNTGKTWDRADREARR